MNFYSDEIMNNIIDYSPIENLLEELDTFKKNVHFQLHRFSGNDIHYKYIDALLGNEKNKVVFYCMDFEFSIYNCPVMMIYRRFISRENPDTIIFYILLLCTKPSFRNKGYASKLLDGFIEKNRSLIDQNHDQNKKIKIVLSSVENAVLFYESYGFRWTTDKLSDHKVLIQSEKYEKDKEYFIMEMIL